MAALRNAPTFNFRLFDRSSGFGLAEVQANS
jgi:hypothetical protein